MATTMQAGQVYFPPQDYRLIVNTAKRQGKSFAAFVREKTMAGISPKKKKLSFKDVKPLKIKDQYVDPNGALNIDRDIYGMPLNEYTKIS